MFIVADKSSIYFHFHVNSLDMSQFHLFHIQHISFDPWFHLRKDHYTCHSQKDPPRPFAKRLGNNLINENSKLVKMIMKAFTGTWTNVCTWLYFAKKKLYNNALNICIILFTFVQNLSEWQKNVLNQSRVIPPRWETKCDILLNKPYISINTTYTIVTSCLTIYGAFIK